MSRKLKLVSKLCNYGDCLLEGSFDKIIDGRIRIVGNNTKKHNIRVVYCKEHAELIGLI